MFGDELRSARKRLSGVSQETLAQAIAKVTGGALTRQSVQRWESNEVLPESEKWEAIESALALPAGWVYAEINKDRASAQTTITGSPGSCSPVTATDVRNSKISVNHTQTSYHQGTPAELSESERRIIEALRLIDCKDYTARVVEKIEAAVKVLNW